MIIPLNVCYYYNADSKILMVDAQNHCSGLFYVIIFPGVWHAGTGQIAFIGKSEGSIQPVLLTHSTH